MFSNKYSKITDMYTNESKFQIKEDIEHLYIPKEDVFFAWLQEIDLKNDKIRVVTMSFPDYGKTLEQGNSLIKEMENFHEKNEENRQHKTEVIEKAIESGHITRRGTRNFGMVKVNKLPHDWDQVRLRR